MKIRNPKNIIDNEVEIIPSKRNTEVVLIPKIKVKSQEIKKNQKESTKDAVQVVSYKLLKKSRNKRKVKKKVEMSRVIQAELCLRVILKVDAFK